MYRILYTLYRLLRHREAMANTLFISDLHLSANTPAELASFRRLLQEIKKNDVEALYILGDFFEVWIGDDIEDPVITEITQLLNTASQSIKIYLMPGNRDFLVGHAFAQRCGATLLPDPTIINLYGTPTLLMHGDSLCTQDRAYQRWRKISHWRWLQRLFLALPRRFRQNIANRIRQRSKDYGQRLAPAQADAVFSTTVDLMRHYGVNQLIHGHTHQPLIQYFRPQDQWQRRFVLGDWQWKQAGLRVTNAPSTAAQFCFVSL